ncbi:MAG TPA: hypothetical protein VHA06_14410 [Candidatus Angelobacter sp.]|nr:hypothetical protein [Candidatus Angelobacter sp.]
MKRNLWLVLVSLAVLAVGCSRVGDRTDAQVASDVTDKIKADNSVPDKQLTIAANSGTVTLSGNVAVMQRATRLRVTPGRLPA